MTADEQTKQTERKPRRNYEGVVVAANRDKTIKVMVEELTRHPRYNKYLRRRTTMHVHDERNEAKTGDRVEIMECRPVSKTKTWRLVRVVRRSESVTAGATESNQ
ncbi:MAG: 30S ribosomal protein S17 [Phycisphaerae bacterium]|nr:30S ribosomal protein S17 [Phycisphaerae bacterium]